jgi:hypothetical protein
MRVVDQLIGHLRRTGHLTPDQLAELRRMGLLKDARDDDDLPESDVDAEPSDDYGPTDALDAHGDRLIDDARRAGVRRRRGRPKKAGSSFDAAITKAVNEAQRFVDLVVEVAKRLGADADAALDTVTSADSESLAAALVRDSLWARLWPHIARDPVFAVLADNQRRRLSSLAAGASRADQTLPRQLTNNPAVRRAIGIVAASRALSPAFGLAVEAVGPWRAAHELNLAANPTALEVLAILHSAHTPWRTIAELPDLVGEVGLPVPAKLPRPAYESGWEIAARIDPVKVLPLMQWCTRAWAAMPAYLLSSAPGLHIGVVSYSGDWIRPTGEEWFGLRRRDTRWVVVRCSPHHSRTLGEVSQTLTRDGIEYAHACTDEVCDFPRTFQRVGGRETVSVRAVKGLALRNESQIVRADYGDLWAAGLVDMPLLTCPKEWELP